jgi:hypothetical protein
MMRITLANPITIREELYGLDSIQLEETTGMENPKVPSPQDRSHVTIPTQYESPRTSGVTNPLFDLITIYDDEEIF